jgi:DeoR/GlpR family transcriptional regulator of sugar metabolism
MGCQNINILLPGGYLRRTSGSITGLPANNFLDTLTVRKAFLGALGISSEKGMTDIHLIEVELKKSIISRVEEVTILVDGSKFRQTGLSAFAGIRQVKRVITDSTAPKSELEKLRKARVEVLVAS